MSSLTYVSPRTGRKITFRCTTSYGFKDSINGNALDSVSRTVKVGDRTITHRIDTTGVKPKIYNREEVSLGGV